MKRAWRPVAIVLACVALAMVVAILWPGGREPVYQGKRLSEWIREFDPQSVPLDPSGKGGEAVRRIGTNGLPFLIRWIRYTPPDWKRRVSAWLSSLHISDGLAEGNDDRATQAAIAFRSLGSNGLPAAPELFRLLSSTRSGVRLRAVIALAGIGAEAGPFFLEALTNKECALSYPEVLIGWSHLGTNTGRTIPALISHLSDADENVTVGSARMLGMSGIQPERVVPALIDAAASTNARVRCGAVWALGRFGTNASGALPVLVRGLADDDLDVRMAATNALHEVAPGVLGEGHGKL